MYRVIPGLSDEVKGISHICLLSKFKEEGYKSIFLQILLGVPEYSLFSIFPEFLIEKTMAFF